jgi:(R)-2-hydroxyacyl-CoA dehydratese activating ATPase
MTKELFAGIDIGSTMTKVVIVADEKMITSLVKATTPEQRLLAHTVMEEALAQGNIAFDDISCIIATGYGRINVPFADKQVTEISCHTKGVAALVPEVRTIIDIGGQDCKGIKVKNGKPDNFVMNDKCAAGTGRYLEITARALDVKLDEMGELALTSSAPVEISNICTIFTEQEVVSKLSSGIPLRDILGGLHLAIATRIYRLVSRVRIEREVVVTGGCAKNAALVKALESKLMLPVTVPDNPLITGALGAALLAREMVMRGYKKTHDYAAQYGNDSHGE